MGNNMKSYDRVGYQIPSAVYNNELREYMVAVYQYMAFALVITGIVSMGAASSPTFMSLIFSTPLQWVVAFAPLVMAFFMGARITTMSSDAAKVSLGVFAALMGLSLSFIFLVYTGESIARLFFITASVFGSMSFYGYTTKKDLTSFGSFLMMGLIGILIASIVNLFLASNAMQFIISFLGVIIFTGLTAYDTQRIKDSFFAIPEEKTSNVAVYGALMLYMDFINLFVMLLQLFGHRRDE